jgi:beta-N-acetylhexosaminidase
VVSASIAGQLLIVGFDGLEPSPSLLARIGRGEVGGIILFGRNYSSLEQLAHLNAKLRACAPSDAPLLIGIDQEGGRVQRLRSPLFHWPAMSRVAALGDSQLTRSVGRAMGEDLATLGIDLNFAPVLDVVASDLNTVIGDRAFGATAEPVIEHGLAYAAGLADAGLLACGKHFPGHGGPVADSHQTLPVEQRSLPELRASDLRPFVAAIERDLPLLMSAHVVYREIDPSVPATLSSRICTELLRQELGYHGVLISDDLEMAAVADNYSMADAAIAAMSAGIDLLLICHREERQQEALAGLRRRAESDRAFRSRLTRAAERVALLKRRPELRAWSPPTAQSIQLLSAPDRHRAIRQAVADVRLQP